MANTTNAFLPEVVFQKGCFSAGTEVSDIIYQLIKLKFKDIGKYTKVKGTRVIRFKVTLPSK